MKYIFFILFGLSMGLMAQTPEESDSLVIDNGQKDSLQVFRPTIDDYQHFTQFSERKVFDTVFTIDKSYRFSQYNKRDNFGRVAFPNIGDGFQPLTYEISSEQDFTLLPTKKSFFILGIKDIKYYDVKTPTTAFYFLNGMNNGGTLQTTYTQNIGKRFNFAIEYMGLRSQGFYQRNLTNSNNTLFSAHYISHNERYNAFAHYLHQNILNEENGGITDLTNFTSGDSRFNSRQNLSVNLNNTFSRFSIRRYYFSHSITPFDAEKFPFKIKHTIYHQTNKYRYSQTANETYYTSPLISGYSTETNRYSTNLSNFLTLAFDRETFKAEAGVRHQNIHFQANNPLIINGAEVDSRFSENRWGLVGNIALKLWGRIDMKSSLDISNGRTFGNYLHSENHLSLEPLQGYFLNAHLNFKSMAPSFNYLMNPSFYEQYNYKYSDFKNQNILDIGGELQLKWFNTKFLLNFLTINQMPYFDSNGMPQQVASPVNITQIGGEATFSLRKFHLNARLLWQNVLNNRELIPLPNFIGRVNAFYQNKIFKNAAEIQTGIKAYYFSRFASREYFPILNEFILPSNAHSIGGQPIIDIYANLKVKRMMIFAEAQHMNSLIRNRSFAAPFYPISDFRVSLGVVWYLFH